MLVAVKEEKKKKIHFKCSNPAAMLPLKQTSHLKCPKVASGGGGTYRVDESYE